MGEFKMSSRTKKQLFIILGLLIIINALLLAIYKAPTSHEEYTGSYQAKVYEDGKLNKSRAKYSLLVLNYDGSGSAVIDGDATNGKWSVSGDKIVIGKKELKVQGNSLIYLGKTKAGEKLKVVFSSMESNQKGQKGTGYEN